MLGDRRWRDGGGVNDESVWGCFVRPAALRAPLSALSAAVDQAPLASAMRNALVAGAARGLCAAVNQAPLASAMCLALLGSALRGFRAAIHLAAPTTAVRDATT